jgi:PKD repeat protein
MSTPIKNLYTAGVNTKQDYKVDWAETTKKDWKQDFAATHVVAPVAAFVADVVAGPHQLRVRFTDNSTNYPTKWSWTFGDGCVSTLQNPVHIYSTPGTYTVSVTAYNSAGSNVGTRNAYITVS